MVYIPTFTIKINVNVGKYTIQGSVGYVYYTVFGQIGTTPRARLRTCWSPGFWIAMTDLHATFSYLLYFTNMKINQSLVPVPCWESIQV